MQKHVQKNTSNFFFFVKNHLLNIRNFLNFSYYLNSQCKNKQCIKILLFCDNERNCFDSSDEFCSFHTIQNIFNISEIFILYKKK